MLFAFFSICLISGHQVLAGSSIQFSGYNGFLSLPPSEDKSPALILVHDIFGLDPFVKQEVDRWAEKGLVVLAPDLFLGEQPKTEAEAQRRQEKTDPEQILKMIESSFQYLKSHPRVDRQRIGFIGWGDGGSLVLRWLIREKEGVRFAVMVEAQPKLEPSELKKIKSRLAFVYPKLNPAFPEGVLNRFEKALKESQILFDIKFVDAKRSRYWNYSRTEFYEAKPAEAAKNMVSDWIEKHLTLNQHRK